MTYGKFQLSLSWSMLSSFLFCLFFFLLLITPGVFSEMVVQPVRPRTLTCMFLLYFTWDAKSKDLLHLWFKEIPYEQFRDPILYSLNLTGFCLFVCFCFVLELIVLDKKLVFLISKFAWRKAYVLLLSPRLYSKIS